MAGHLGERAGAFADGELNASQMARAWLHYRSCAVCRDLVEGQREVRAELRKLSSLHLPPDVVNALRALPAERGVPAHQARARVRRLRRPRAGRPGGRRHPELFGAVRRPLSNANATRLYRATWGAVEEGKSRRRARRGRWGMGVVAALAIAGLAGVEGLSLLGNPAESGVAVVEMAQAASSEGEPYEVVSAALLSEQDQGESAAALAWMRRAGWSVPEALPAGYAVADYSQVELEGRPELVVNVATPTGSLWLTLRHASLDTSALGALHLEVLGGRAVYDQDVGGQLTGVFQSGHDLAAFVSNASDEALAAVVAVAPQPSSASLASRISLGWHALLARLR